MNTPPDARKAVVGPPTHKLHTSAGKFLCMPVYPPERCKLVSHLPARFVEIGRHPNPPANRSIASGARGEIAG